MYVHMHKWFVHEGKKEERRCTNKSSPVQAHGGGTSSHKSCQDARFLEKTAAWKEKPKNGAAAVAVLQHKVI